MLTPESDLAALSAAWREMARQPDLGAIERAAVSGLLLRIISWYGTVVDIEEQKAALERSQRIADALQTAFLPPSLPQRERLQLSAHYISVEEDALVGGDWYDAFELPNGELLFSIGDVGGHGLPASLAVGRIRQTIFAIAHVTPDPASILAETNGLLQRQEPDLFVTALVGTVSRDERVIRYAPPVIRHRSSPVPARRC